MSQADASIIPAQGDGSEDKPTKPEAPEPAGPLVSPWTAGSGSGAAGVSAPDGTAAVSAPDATAAASAPDAAAAVSAPDATAAVAAPDGTAAEDAVTAVVSPVREDAVASGDRDASGSGVEPPPSGGHAEAVGSAVPPGRHRSEPRERRTMRLLLLAGGSVLLLAYVVAVIAAGSGVARGTTVLGVEIGGLSTSEAVAKLRSELPARLPARLTLVASEDQATVASDEVGLAVDYEATVAAADGGSLNPFRLIAQLGGAGPVEPVVTANDTAMNTVIESLAAEFTRAPVEGTITFTDGAASAVAPVPGRELDVEQADAVLRQAYAAGRASFDAPVDVTEPQVGQAEVDRAMTELARPAVSGPITLNVADASIEVPVDTFAPYLSMTADSGRLALAVDGAKLHRALDDELDSVELNSKNATFRIVNGKPEVVPSKDGRAVAPADLAAAFVAALPNPTDRRAEAELTVATPSLTTAQAQNLGVVERVSTWTTNVPYAPYRATNIRQAVKYLSGTVVLPGAEFSLNDEVGPRTAERGFVRGIVINGGVLDADWGGGISALATTVFNAVFYGGLEDVEHHPHSYWITRYPKGTEATVSWGAKDLRFVNDSGNGIFITASSTDTTVTITFWGTKKYDISRIEGEEYNVTPYEEIEKDRCFPQPGMRGFDIDVWRVFKQNGDEVKREKFTTHYIPADHVTCKEVITP